MKALLTFGNIGVMLLIGVLVGSVTFGIAYIFFSMPS